MKRGARDIETVKTVLIVLLALSALILAGRLDVFGQLFGADSALDRLIEGRGDELPLYDDSADFGSSEAATPLFTVITNAAGRDHYGCKYSGAQRDQIYAALETLLSEALGSAGEAQRVSQEQWRKALGSEGVFADYLNAVPYSVLAGWLGANSTKETAEHMLRRLCIAATGQESAELFYINENNGEYLRCTTGVSLSSLSQVLEGYMPNGAHFAFEMGELYSLCDPYLVICDETQAPARLSFSPVSASAAETVAKAFDINPNTVTPFTESDGTVVYIESGCSLRISPDGRVVYRETGDGRIRIRSGAHYRVDAAVEGARRIVEKTMQIFAGDAKAEFTGVSSENGEITVSFGFVADGKSVIHPNGYEVFVRIRDGAVVYAQLLMRSYTLSPETDSVLPEIHAAAMIDDGREPVLCYVENDGVMSARWVKR